MFQLVFDLFILTNPISRMFYKVIQCQTLMDSPDKKTILLKRDKETY